MASDGTGARILGFPIGMAVGLVGLVLTVGVLGLIWKEQLSSLGKGGEELGLGPGAGPERILDSTRVTATIIKMREVGDALEGFRAESGGYPEDIVAATNRPTPPSDRWGAPMEYDTSGGVAGRAGGRPVYKEYTLVSLGADGLRGTDDDLVMHNGVVDMSVTTSGNPRGSGGDAGGAAAGSSDAPPPSSPGSRALDAARGVAAGARSQPDPSGGE